MADQQWVSTSVPYLTAQPPGHSEAWATAAAAENRRGTQRIVEAGETVPPAEIAGLLGLSPEETAIVRRRVIYLDDVPLELTDSYYPAAIAQGSALAVPRPIRGGAITLLAKLGHVGRRVVEEVGARHATDAERETFGLAPTSPILVLTRVILNDQGQPIQADMMVTPASAQRLRYEMMI
ncbi:GntR family transcriptional regulator [Nonomuraea sp. NPDC049714]|uniref:GntR family transcriptional regulator n=1 Tax=Nonomuraea sp. NPDC049714 TaxID=3364357 RepID=UPI0037970802